MVYVESKCSLEPDPLRFSDFPIMVVGWGFATVKRGSGRKSLWAHTFRMLLCKHHIKIHPHANFSPLLLHSLTIYIEENLGSDYNYNLRKGGRVFIHVFVLEHNFYI